VAADPAMPVLLFHRNARESLRRPDLRRDDAKIIS
jgi:hypothetical protein